MMSRTRTMCGAVVAAAVCFSAGPGIVQAAVTFDWATVGNPGNTADTEVMNDGTMGYGSVDYAYRISKHEVTNAQYAEFLNTVAATDSFSLYNDGFAGFIGNGITRRGVSGSFTYATVAGRENDPVVFVSWYDTLRFSNWLHNGQGAGDTETGAYTLLGGTAIPGNGDNIMRNTGADFFLPSEDEWYKAAYYDPATDSYFDYATSSNTVPQAHAPVGGNNSANYNNFAITTAVGAYTNSVSPFGTFDQTGNVIEWNESLISGSFRGIRGGGWLGTAFILPASFRNSTGPTLQSGSVGFRVASRVVVPEPASIFILAFGGAVVLGVCKRRRVV